MRKLVPVLPLLILFMTACATPLRYSEMTPDQRDQETVLQGRIQAVSASIAKLGLNSIKDVEQRKKLVNQVLPLLQSAVKILQSKSASEWKTELIAQTVAHLKELNSDIQAVASDAFDLFNGWVNLPGLNDLLPDVVRDRLLAFLNGAIMGLQQEVQ